MRVVRKPQAHGRQLPGAPARPVIAVVAVRRRANSHPSFVALTRPEFLYLPESEIRSLASDRLCKLSPSFIGQSVNRGQTPGISPGANSASRPPDPHANYI